MDRETIEKRLANIERRLAKMIAINNTVAIERINKRKARLTALLENAE